MSIKKVRIILTADMQYKNRDKNLVNSYTKTSEEIEKVLIDTKADIYAFCGDFTEYATPNDSERTMMFRHLGNVLNINTVKELVVMNGNHDILGGKKIESAQRENNPLDTFVKTSKSINPELSKKINYLKKQQEYESIVSDLISWVSYSIEDGLSVGDNLYLNEKYNNRYRIPVFHDILREYVDDKKLPISKSKMDFLMKLEDFKTNENQKAIILAGDIHENFETMSKSDSTQGSKHFIYPGSPIQRNHGEGSYFRVKPTGPQVVKADVKVVKQIDLYLDEDNIDNTYYEISDIKLTDTLHYIKIDLNTKKFVDNWQEQLTHLLSNVKLSKFTNIVKLEISNIYMKYEMDILSMVNTYLTKENEKTSCVNYLELAYGTVVFDKDDILIDENVDEESIDNMTEESVDDIVLNQDKLKQIFTKILEANNQNILKEFTNPEEFNEIVTEIQTLFEEQIDTTYGSKTSYNTELEKITTTGFMALGANEINLDIPGLTKIDGNNGIGKTTLFNMLRWNIKGTVLEGLAKNVKKENLLLVFNYELPEQDFLVNTLYLKVNDIPVEIERNARRTWKKSATEDDKKSLNWKNFIDTATTNLTLRVYPKDKEMVVKMNDEAQNMIDQWFGNTIETIFILNQFKILQLLNSSGDALKESVLEYIGVDYTKSLIGNLEMVKPLYVVSKPEKAQMDIVVEKNKTSIAIHDNNETISRNTHLIDTYNDEKNLAKNNINAKNQQLIDVGNVPDQLKNFKLTETELNNNIAGFEFKMSKELPMFDLVQPVRNDELIDELQLKVDASVEEITKLETIIQDNNNGFNKTKEDKLTVINQNIATFKGKIEDFKIKAKETFTSTNDTIVPMLKEFKSNAEKHHEKIFAARKYTLQENGQRIRIAISDNTAAFNKIMTQINELREQIDNDMCKACQRPIGLTKEQIADKEAEILVLSESRKEYGNTELNTELELNDVNVALINKEEREFNMLLNWRSEYTSLLDFENEFKIVRENESTFDMFADYTKFLDNLDKGKVNWILFNEIDNNPEIKEIEATIEKFNKLLTVVANLSIFTIVTDELKAIGFIIDLLNHIDKNTETTTLRSDEIVKRIENEKKVSELVIEYNNKISDYNIKLTNHNKTTQDVNTYNSQIVEHNKKQIEWENDLKRLAADILKSEENLYYYEKYKAELITLNDELKEIEDNILKYTNENVTLEKNNLLYEANIETLNELEQKWKDYRKKNFIYKTYEKLIKNDFKYAIFNYYRQFLNNKLNILLEGLNFRLYWNSDSNLYMVKIAKVDGVTEMVYLPVKLASGMQTAFLGLSLIYSFHLLNIRNSISHILIDEISGQLNSGKNSTASEEEVNDEATMKNYQEQLVMLLSRFDKKKVFIVDHVIENLYETYAYNVKRKEIDGKVVTVFQ